jgi:hypothetical protein
VKKPVKKVMMQLPDPSPTPSPVPIPGPSDPNVIIRVHVDEDTIDIPWLSSTAHSTAELYASRGVWTANRKKFYPAKNIVYIEVL